LLTIPNLQSGKTKKEKKKIPKGKQKKTTKKKTDHKVEEGVKDQNSVGRHAGNIQKNSRSRTIQRVGNESGLNHNQSIRGGFSTKNSTTRR
jgi:hypothetical protein